MDPVGLCRSLLRGVDRPGIWCNRLAGRQERYHSDSCRRTWEFPCRRRMLLPASGAGIAGTALSAQSLPVDYNRCCDTLGNRRRRCCVVAGQHTASQILTAHPRPFMPPTFLHTFVDALDCTECPGLGGQSVSFNPVRCINEKSRSGRFFSRRISALMVFRNARKSNGA